MEVRQNADMDKIPVETAFVTTDPTLKRLPSCQMVGARARQKLRACYTEHYSKCQKIFKLLNLFQYLHGRYT